MSGAEQRRPDLRELARTDPEAGWSLVDKLRARDREELAAYLERVLEEEADG